MICVNLAWSCLECMREQILFLPAFNKWGAGILTRDFMAQGFLWSLDWAAAYSALALENQPNSYTQFLSGTLVGTHILMEIGVRRKSQPSESSWPSLPCTFRNSSGSFRAKSWGLPQALLRLVAKIRQKVRPSKFQNSTRPQQHIIVGRSWHRHSQVQIRQVQRTKGNLLEAALGTIWITLRRAQEGPFRQRLCVS